MKKLATLTALVTTAVLLLISSLPSPALALEEFFTAKLRGGNETPLTLFTPGTGMWAAQLDGFETSLTFALLYTNLTGPSVTQAHIHLGQPGITGGIVIHFCGSGGKPACPPSGRIDGTVTATDVVPVPAQGIALGAFADVIRSIRRGDAYVNVHTGNFPGGEIRGPIQ